MNYDTKQQIKSGAVWLGLLTLASCDLIVLRLVGKLDWSFWLLLAPLWIPIGLFLLFFAIIAIVSFLTC